VAGTRKSIRRRRSRRGFTLVEIALAVVVLVVAMLAMSASTLRMHGLRRTNRELALAQNAVRSIAEEVRAISRAGADSAAGWSTHVRAALAAGGSLGSTFEVRELTPPEGQPTVGTIEVVDDETVTDAELGLDAGMPRDLDGDGLATNGEVGAGARLLLVVLRARWRGARGEHELSHPFYVASY
jgi:prepilin-type N-terminal cleavage/methylation domain-containing protein